MTENTETYNKLKKISEDFAKLQHYISKHDKCKDAGYKLDYEDKILEILDEYSIDEAYPAYGSKWVCKRDNYRYNMDIYQGDIATVEEIRISKGISVVVLIKSYQKIMSIKDFKTLFKEKGE